MKLNKKNKRDVIVYVITIILSIVYLIGASHIASGGKDYFDTDMEKPIRATVLRITKTEDIGFEDENGQMQTSMTMIYFEAKALSGEQRGKTLFGVQEQDLMFALRQPDVQVGDKITLAYEPTPDGKADYYLADYSRTGPLYALCGVFFVLLLIFGRKKGLDTIISLTFTTLAVFVTLIPAILNGQNIYFWSIMTCIFITVMTLLLIDGINIKSLAAGIGCVAGVLVSGLIFLMMKGVLHITGMLDDEWVYLHTLNKENPIDLKAVIFAMIIIGAVGAVMDVAMSIASSLSEIHEKSPELSTGELFKSGITIGRDIMGTMANTLILAYIGSCLTCVLLYISYSLSVSQIINRELIAVEILQSLAGSLGILSALPLTALVSAVLLKRFNRPRKIKDEDELDSNISIAERKEQ